MNAIPIGPVPSGLFYAGYLMAILFDLDGVFYRGKEIVPDAALADPAGRDARGD